LAEASLMSNLDWLLFVIIADPTSVYSCPGIDQTHFFNDK
jgi:hypothetical protein